MPTSNCNLSHQEPLAGQDLNFGRDTRDQVVRIGAILEGHIKRFDAFVEESRESRKEMLGMIEDIHHKHKQYDETINKDRGRWAVAVPIIAFVSSLLTYFVEYFLTQKK